jgi:uncharacterized protein YjdB
MKERIPLRHLTALTAGLVVGISACTITVPNPAALNPSPVQASPPVVAPASVQPASSQPAKSVSSIRLTPDTVVIGTGSAKAFMATVGYSDGTNDSAVAWTSSDDTILNVNPTTGQATGLKAGVASVVAAAVADPTRKATATVTVRSGEVVDAVLTIAPTEATLKVGETVRLQAKSQQSDGGMSPNVVWTSDNKTVAVVSNGLVTAVGVGQTTVTATAAGDSTKQVSAKITVVGQ